MKIIVLFSTHKSSLELWLHCTKQLEDTQYTSSIILKLAGQSLSRREGQEQQCFKEPALS